MKIEWMQLQNGDLGAVVDGNVRARLTPQKKHLQGPGFHVRTYNQKDQQTGLLYVRGPKENAQAWVEKYVSQRVRPT